VLILIPVLIGVVEMVVLPLLEPMVDLVLMVLMIKVEMQASGTIWMALPTIVHLGLAVLVVTGAATTTTSMRHQPATTLESQQLLVPVITPVAFVYQVFLTL
jgi:hypothetical protein